MFAKAKISVQKEKLDIANDQMRGMTSFIKLSKVPRSWRPTLERRERSPFLKILISVQLRVVL